LRRIRLKLPYLPLVFWLLHWFMCWRLWCQCIFILLGGLKYEN